MKSPLKALLLFFFTSSFIFYFSCTPKTAETVEKSKAPDELIGIAAENKPAMVPPVDPWGADKKVPVDPDVRIGTLPNGMKYYIRKNSKPENRAELRLAVNAGAMQEDEDQLGLAHFVEHMAFNGTKNFEKSELVDYLESVGTRFGPDLNAYTSFDETVYMLQVRTDDQELFDKGMLILQDWASGVTFDHEEIDKERGVVESEWRSRLSPNQRMLNQWLPIMYKDSRYAQRLPIGKPEIIKNASYETVKRFYKDWYRPELMALVVVGDFNNMDIVEQQIKNSFGNISNETPTRKKASNQMPKHDETYIAVVSDKEAPFTNIQLVYKHDHEPTTNMKEYRNNIIRRLYNGMLSDRLSEIAQSPDPPFTFAYTGYSRDVGKTDTYSSYAMVPEGGAKRGLEVVLEENERVLKHGFTQSELDRQKTTILTNMEKAFKEKDKTDSRRFASRYVYNYLDNNPMPAIDEELKFYEELLPTIKLDEVNALAKKWITKNNRVVVVTGPEKKESPLPTEDDIKLVLSTVTQKNIQPYIDKVDDSPLLEKELRPVAIASEKKLDAIGVIELVMGNGVKVVLKPTDFKNDEILITSYSDGGTSLYADEDYPNASNASRIMNESGVSKFDIVQLEKKLAGKTVSLYSYISELSEGFNGNASPDDVETLFQLIYLAFDNPRKDPDALTSFVSKQKAIYSNLLSQPDYYFSDQVSQIQYGNHLRRGFPKAADLDKVNIDKVYEIYKDRFADASDFTFVIVGAFDMEMIKPLLSKYIGNLPSTKRKETWKDINADYQKGVIKKTVVKGEAPKALVNITFHGDFDWTPENRYHFRSMIDVLRIKMRESMREDKGGVYGVRVSGSPQQFPDKEYNITISFNADPPRVDELIETAMNDIATAKKIGAEEKDLTKVKETQKQGRIKDLKENRFWSRQLRSAYQNGFDPNNITLEQFEKGINSLTAENIKAAANKYFDMENYIQVVLLPEEK